MVEKMARASVRAGVGELDFDQWPEEQKKVFLRQMRSALEAMREPDDAMRSVFIEADWNDWPAESAFVVAIDKAIQESGE
jgi:hypothetical protein